MVASPEPGALVGRSQQGALQDLRVVDARGERVPFALLAPRGATLPSWMPAIVAGAPQVVLMGNSRGGNAIRSFDFDDDVQSIVVTGGERAFSGGADVKEFGTPLAGREPRSVVLSGPELGAWDSSLALFIRCVQLWSGKSGATLVLEQLPAGAVRLAGSLAREPLAPPTQPLGLPDLPTAVGTETVRLWRETKDFSQLVGECVFSMGRFFKAQAHFRWRDCFAEMQQCGAMALPIVGGFWNKISNDKKLTKLLWEKFHFRWVILFMEL